MSTVQPISPDPFAHAPDIAQRLLAWYDRHHRELPWRISPRMRANGNRADPYRVWLSEIMLQQTTVATVKSYYHAFLERWPDVEALAAAETSEVMKAWAGLGYYSRARNLKKCAETVVAENSGRFPATEAGLAALPGIGPYTAAAIAAIAFDRPAPVVDGNVERVFTRIHAIETPLPAAKPEIRAAVARLVPADRPGDFAQATMDLGATLCTPKRPKCVLCPLREDCTAIRHGDPERFPLKAAKAQKPARKGAAFVAVAPDGSVLLRRRPEKGLLGGMSEVPTTAWTARNDGGTDPSSAPFAADWQPRGSVAHVFTHFSLELSVFEAAMNGPAPEGHWWSPPHQLPGEALPTVMKKVLETARPGITRKSPKPGRTS
ncbi:MAG: A/G-specific adenine glycosylase [Rhizobiaceae bacterium]